MSGIVIDLDRFPGYCLYVPKWELFESNELAGLTDDLCQFVPLFQRELSTPGHDVVCEDTLG